MTPPRLFAALALVLAAGCDSQPTGELVRPAPEPPPKPARELGSPVRSGQLSQRALAFFSVAAPEDTDLAKLREQALAAAREAGFTTAHEVYDTDAHAISVNVEPKGSDDEAPESSLPADQRAIYDHAAFVVTIGVASTDRRDDAARIAATIAAGAASSCRGVILERDTNELALPADLKAAFGPHHYAADLVRVRLWRNDDGTDSGATLGMERIGLPDVYIARLSRQHLDSARDLLTGAAQQLIDGGDVAADGELKGSVASFAGWDLTRFRRDGGDGTFALHATWSRGTAAADADVPEPDRDVELSAGDGSVEAMTGASMRFYGYDVDAPDEPGWAGDLRTAAGKARTAYRALARTLASGIPDGASLAVKATFHYKLHGNPFTAILWVDVTDVHGDSLEGDLENGLLEVDGLAEGDHVTVKAADLADLEYDDGNGKRIGGFVIAAHIAHGEDLVAW